MDVTQESDEVLFTLIRGYDPEATQGLTELQRRHNPGLLRRAGDIVGFDSADAPVAVQNTWVRLWESGAQLQPGQPFRALLFKVLRDEALMLRRGERRRRKKVENELPAPQAQALAAHLAACAPCRAEYAEVERMVRALRSLPEPEMPADLMQRVEAEIRRRGGLRPRPAADDLRVEREALARRARFRLIPRWKGAVALAAVLLLGLSVWLAAPGGGSEGTMQVFALAGGPGSAQEEVRVVITMTKGKAPVVGATFDVLADGRKVGHGKVTGARDDGAYDGLAWSERGEDVRKGDRVRFPR